MKVVKEILDEIKNIILPSGKEFFQTGFAVILICIFCMVLFYFISNLSLKMMGFIYQLGF